jgi:hypothetical protein
LDCGISRDYSAFDHDFAADTYAVVIASTFSEFTFIPKTNTAANPTVNTIKTSLTISLGTKKSITTGRTGKTLDITVATPLAIPARDESSKQYIWYLGFLAAVRYRLTRTSHPERLCDAIGCNLKGHKVGECSLLVPDAFGISQ